MKTKILEQALLTNSCVTDTYRLRMLLGGALLMLASLPGAAQDAKVIFRQCASCHVLDANGPARVGPTLSGIVGRAAGSVPGYQYSAALLQKNQEGLVWDLQSLDVFLTSPSAFAPGTKMAFIGIAKAEHRQSLIQWIADSAPGETGDSADAAAGSEDPEVQKILALEADADFGEYLAGECVTCHQSSGAAAGGVPTITQLPAADFVSALLEYKNGQRSNQVMKLMTDNLGDDEIASLAEYFSTLEK